MVNVTEDRQGRSVDVDRFEKARPVHLLAPRDHVVSQVLEVGRYVGAEDIDRSELVNDGAIGAVRSLVVRPWIASNGLLESTAGDEPETKAVEVDYLAVTMPQATRSDGIPRGGHVHVSERHQGARPK
jgi:hypothetical protein